MKICNMSYKWESCWNIHSHSHSHIRKCSKVLCMLSSLLFTVRLNILQAKEPHHSAFLSVGKVTVKSEYTGHSGIEWPLICHKNQKKLTRVSKDMATLTCLFWEPWKTKYRFNRFFTINMKNLMFFFWSGFLFNLKLAKLP